MSTLEERLKNQSNHIEQVKKDLAEKVGIPKEPLPSFSEIGDGISGMLGKAIKLSPSTIWNNVAGKGYPWNNRYVVWYISPKSNYSNANGLLIWDLFKNEIELKSLFGNNYNNRPCPSIHSKWKGVTRGSTSDSYRSIHLYQFPENKPIIEKAITLNYKNLWAGYVTEDAFYAIVSDTNYKCYLVKQCIDENGFTDQSTRWPLTNTETNMSSVDSGYSMVVKGNSVYMIRNESGWVDKYVVFNMDTGIETLAQVVSTHTGVNHIIQPNEFGCIVWKYYTALSGFHQLRPNQWFDSVEYPGKGVQKYTEIPMYVSTSPAIGYYQVEGKFGLALGATSNISQGVNTLLWTVGGL